jgi:hypothetical protein
MRRVFPALIVLAVSIVSLPAGGQTLVQPTPGPAVTAENEPWFVSRAPLVFGGTLYFPAGAQVHFNQNEMVPTGFYGRVPVYVRTTLEPRSVIFVPLTGGVMQPYERRRSGELAGTEGSTAPSFPIENAAEASASEPRTLRAPGPPIAGVAATMGVASPEYAATAPPAEPARAVGTTGTVDVIRGRSLTSASRPEGLNGIFINYSSRRWFNSGEAVPFDSAAFKRIGTYGSLPVYSRPGVPETIFIPVTESATGLVVPYSTTRAR